MSFNGESKRMFNNDSFNMCSAPIMMIDECLQKDQSSLAASSAEDMH